MAGSSRTQPQTVPDPDREAYERMCRRQRAYNEAQEARLCGPSTAEKVQDTAGLAGKVQKAGEIGSAMFAVLSGADDDLKAAEAIKKFGGKVGPALSLTAAKAGYDVDRQRGVPVDEALIRNGGGFALGQGLGKVGAFGFGTIARLNPRLRKNPAGVMAAAGVGEYIGERDGEMLADDLANGWAGLKAGARDVGGAIRQGVGALNDPAAHVGRRRMGPDPYGRW